MRYCVAGSEQELAVVAEEAPGLSPRATGCALPCLVGMRHQKYARGRGLARVGLGLVVAAFACFLIVLL